MSFLDQVAADNRSVFSNTAEFAEKRDVEYDGVTYSKIPVTLTRLMQSKMTVPVTEHTDGLRKLSAKAHILLDDLGGIEPEEGTWIRIEDGTALGRPFMRRYMIVTCGNSMGMLTLELEAKED